MINEPPLFFNQMRGSSIHSKNYPTAILSSYPLSTLSTMNTSSTGNGGSSILGPLQQGMLNTCADHHTTNTNYGHSNSNVGNVSYSYNNTTNVGTEEESLRIQEWLSPLEPYKRHRDVRNGRLKGIREWILRRSEFESWFESQDESVDRTLLCYGGQGVGKTYIR